ncbi:hypothetical protein SAMN05660895_1096 [Thermoflavifilum thermophilum]|uniref:Uncharacterized protein n=2 Tax=Thermoflavifilum thermophilum TaxID=1393122 RepID=A0A1I7NA92_9BACT|nr:hypothetical protein SAMN05660895_1096 [Thermoflavifilum thermophilum]
MIYRWGLCLLPVLSACNPSSSPASEPGQQTPDTSSPGFSSPQEAAAQGQKDLLAILRMHSGDTYGITDTTLLAKAVPGNPVMHYVLDFQRLLQIDSANSLSDFPKEEANTIVPLVTDGQLVTIVELSHQDQQWKVAALAGKALTDDLQVIYQIMPRYAGIGQGAQIQLIEVPNLQAKLFVVRANPQGERLGPQEWVFARYAGFSLREPVPVSTLMSVLHRDAVQFQREYGEQLKKQKLTE